VVEFKVMIRRVLFLVLLPALILAKSEPYAPGSPWRGVWIRSDKAEVFVATQPRIRVLHIARPVNDTLLRTIDDDISGVKTAFREPGHTPLSFAVCDQPGEIMEHTDTSVVVESPVHPEARLAIRLRMEMLKDGESFLLTHALINHADMERRLAVWSLAAVPRKGILRIPFPPGSHLEHHSGNMPIVEKGRMLVEFHKHLEPYITRQTLHSPIPHWELGFQSQTLHSSTFLTSQEPNLIVYQDSSPTEQFAEVEHIGPLETVAPGKTVFLVEKLSLNTFGNLANGARSTLVLNRKQGLWAAPDGTSPVWEGRFGHLPLFAFPLKREDGSVTTAWELPPVSVQQYPHKRMDRDLEIRFVPPADRKPRQFLAEFGGSGNGVSVYIQEDHLHACAWGTSEGTLSLVHDSVAIPKGRDPMRVRLSLHHRKGFKLLLDRRGTRPLRLPDIDIHRSPSAIGGVSRNTRTHEGVVKHGEGLFHGTILEVQFRLEPRLERP